MPAILELHLTCARGRETECAQHLRAHCRGDHWEILAALAAELVFEHERVNAGARVVLVASADQADRALADLAKTPPEGPALQALRADLNSRR